MSVEFADYREYAPGDDLKRLDWRAYARTNRHVVKQYEEESNVRVTFLGGRPFFRAARIGRRYDRILVQFQPSLYYRSRHPVSKVMAFP